MTWWIVAIAWLVAGAVVAWVFSAVATDPEQPSTPSGDLLSDVAVHDRLIVANYAPGATVDVVIAHYISGFDIIRSRGTLDDGEPLPVAVLILRGTHQCDDIGCDDLHVGQLPAVAIPAPLVGDLARALRMAGEPL